MTFLTALNVYVHALQDEYNIYITNHTFLEKYPQPKRIEQSDRQQLISRQQRQQQKTKIIDVFGQKTEPNCNYHTCHHKFSLHGLSCGIDTARSKTDCIPALLIIRQSYFDLIFHLFLL